MIDTPSSPADGRLQVTPVFPTLIAESHNPDGEAMNRDLAAFVRERERMDRDQSPFTTVNHGWQSGLDLLDAPLPAVTAFRAWINRQIEAYLNVWGGASFSPGAPRRFRYEYTGWAVILRTGGFQHEHVHSKTDLVGVYYVEVPPPQEGTRPGALTLLDPRAGRVAARSVWESVQHAVLPEAGKLVMFPSFVPHRVDQLTARGERISINFDVTLHGVG
jgi:uncharacterized protein (TIGR02466 family)